MGQLTRGIIIKEGMLLGGDDTIQVRVNTWLQEWLDSQYRAWPWPFLQQRASNVALATGTQAVAFGNGAVVATPVQRVLSPIYVGSSDYGTKARAYVSQLGDHDTDQDETLNNPSTFRGLPAHFRVRPSATTWGTWSLIPLPFPDKAYVAHVDYLMQPAALSAIVSTTDLAADTAVPLYPNDRTMIQAVKTAVLEWNKNADQWKMNLDILASMVIDDKHKFGEVAGANDFTGLDGSVFK